MNFKRVAFCGAAAVLAAFAFAGQLRQSAAPVGFPAVASECQVQHEMIETGMRATVRMAAGRACTIDAGVALGGVQVHTEPGAGTLQIGERAFTYAPSNGADRYDAFTLAGQLNARLAPGGAQAFELVVTVEIVAPEALTAQLAVAAR
jgi:hypothetical protein